MLAYAGGMIDHNPIRERFLALSPHLDERGRRMFAAAEALAAGHGGVAAVRGRPASRGARSAAGWRSCAAGGGCRRERVRRQGGGRRPLVDTDPSLLGDLRDWSSRPTRGDPKAPLLWTAKSLRNLAAGLRELGHRIGHNVVADLLRELGYSLQANRKTREGTNHPDRDAQFGYINEQVKQALAAGEPAISVDTKKKELVGDFKNGGREYRPKGQPEPVRVHDFLIPELGRAAPYGVYDIADNAGWVSVGIDHDTASFAVNAIRRWWQAMGRARYPQRQAASDHRRWRRQQRRRACGCGSASCKTWPTNSALPSPSATCRPAPASGTRSSIACSRSSPKTGAAGRSSATRSSSN